MDGVLLDLVLALDGDDGGQRALGDDGHARLLGVGLGQIGEGFGDAGHVRLGHGQRVRLGVRRRLGLVADDVIPVLRAGVQRVLEELGDEGRRHVDDQRLVVGGRFLAEGLDGGRADYLTVSYLLGIKEQQIRGISTGEVVTTDVVELGILHQLPDLGALQVVEVVVVRGTQVSAQAAVVSGNNHAAATRGHLGVDTVLYSQTDLLDGVAEDGGILVVADAAEVDGAVGAQDVRGATGRVLGRAAGDQLRVVVVQQLVVQRRVLGRGQDRVVGLEVVLLEQLLRAHRLDVCCVCISSRLYIRYSIVYKSLRWAKDDLCSLLETGEIRIHFPTLIPNMILILY